MSDGVDQAAMRVTNDRTTNDPLAAQATYSINGIGSGALRQPPMPDSFFGQERKRPGRRQRYGGRGVEPLPRCTPHKTEANALLSRQDLRVEPLPGTLGLEQLFRHRRDRWHKRT